MTIKGKKLTAVQNMNTVDSSSSLHLKDRLDIQHQTHYNWLIKVENPIKPEETLQIPCLICVNNLEHIPNYQITNSKKIPLNNNSQGNNGGGRYEVKNTLKILSNNIRSMGCNDNNNFNFYLINRTLINNQKLDIFFLQETWLNKNTGFPNKNYEIINNLTKESKAAGVSTLINKNHLKAVRILHQYNTQHCQILKIKINESSKEFFAINLYLPHRNNPDKSKEWENFKEIIKNLKSSFENPEILIATDINEDIRDTLNPMHIELSNLDITPLYSKKNKYTWSVQRKDQEIHKYIDFFLTHNLEALKLEIFEKTLNTDHLNLYIEIEIKDRLKRNRMKIFSKKQVSYFNYLMKELLLTNQNEKEILKKFKSITSNKPQILTKKVKYYNYFKEIEEIENMIKDKENNHNLEIKNKINQLIKKTNKENWIKYIGEIGTLHINNESKIFYTKLGYLRNKDNNKYPFIECLRDNSNKKNIIMDKTMISELINAKYQNIFKSNETPEWKKNEPEFHIKIGKN